MSRKIILIFIALLFLGEISVDESESRFNELEIKFFAFVNNANGIQLYNKADDIESKTSIMRYQEGFELYGSYGEEIKGKTWRKVKFHKNDFYILEGGEYFQFEAKNDSTDYALVQEKNLVLYEKPFKDAKVIGKLEQFSIVKTSGLYRLGSDFLSGMEMDIMYNQLSTWYKVTNSKQVTGFILNGIGEISSLESVEENKSKKALHIKGFCETISTGDDFYSDEILQQQVDDKAKKAFQKEKFLPTDSSFEKNETRYYSINLKIYTKKTKMELDKTEKNPFKPKFRKKYIFETFEAYIPEKQCKFYTEREYSDYSASHSKFKGDKQAIHAMKKAFDENHIYLEYTDFKLIPLNPKKSKSDSYFLSVVPSKNLNSSLKYDGAILLVKRNEKYEAVSNSLYPNLELIDIDKDGILELIVRAPMRGDTSDNNLFLLHKGNYVSINSILPKNETFYFFQDNEIHVEKNIYNKAGEFETTEQVRYKYKKGKFIKAK